MPPEDEFSHQLLAYFFRSCVALYNAKPWKVLGEADIVRINVDVEKPIFANVFGADKPTAPGLSLISAFRSLEEANIGIEEVEHLWTDIAFSGARLSIVFRPEADAPQWLRDVRVANRWPLASPSAFPTIVATEIDGAERDLREEELRALCVAINVVSTFVATRRKQIDAGVPIGEVVKVRDDAGMQKIALVQFPFDPDAPEGWQMYKQYHSENSQANPAFQEVRNAALDLPDANPILDRLVWSFFQDTDPHYLRNEDDWDDAMMRFLSWAIFGVRINGTTLAERALLHIAETTSSAELEVHRRLVHARAGIFRVVTVKRDVGMQLFDVARGDTLDVIERVGTRGLRPDDGLMGTFHPISDTQWIMSPGAVMYPSAPDESFDAEEDLSIEDFGPLVEASVFGASLEWIREIPPDALQEAYELFADVIVATGDVMPTYEELQREIASCEQPTQLVEKFGNRASWTGTETEVMLSFLMIIWNATPRAELGGKSPDAVFAAPGRVRATRSPGGRRMR